MTDIRALPADIGGDTAGAQFAATVRAALLGFAGIAVLLLVWELLPRIFTLKAGTKLFFTTPSQIVGTLWRLFETGVIWAPLGVSAEAFLVGLALAVAAGLPLGVLIGRSRTLNAMLDPFITAFNATPRLVFLPLVMLWLGLGLWSKVVIVFIGALFPILINTYEGVRNADRTLINVVRSFGASEWDVARLVVVPNAMPFIIAGLRLAIGRAVLGVVVAEFFGSESGLGVMMVQAAGRYQVDVVFSGPDRVRRAVAGADLDGAASGEPAQPVAAAKAGRRVDIPNLLVTAMITDMHCHFVPDEFLQYMQKQDEFAVKVERTEGDAVDVRIRGTLFDLN